MRVLFCWLFGHHPGDPREEPEIIDYYGFRPIKLWIYMCKGCHKEIVFDMNKGWVLWKKNG